MAVFFSLFEPKLNRIAGNERYPANIQAYYKHYKAEIGNKQLKLT